MCQRLKYRLGIDRNSRCKVYRRRPLWENRLKKSLCTRIDVTRIVNNWSHWHLPIRTKNRFRSEMGKSHFHAISLRTSRSIDRSLNFRLEFMKSTRGFINCANSRKVYDDDPDCLFFRGTLCTHEAHSYSHPDSDMQNSLFKQWRVPKNWRGSISVG